jgi:hypothetical protein
LRFAIVENKNLSLWIAIRASGTAAIHRSTADQAVEAMKAAAGQTWRRGKPCQRSSFPTAGKRPLTRLVGLRISLHRASVTGQNAAAPERSTSDRLPCGTEFRAISRYLQLPPAIRPRRPVAKAEVRDAVERKPKVIQSREEFERLFSGDAA